MTQQSDMRRRQGDLIQRAGALVRASVIDEHAWEILGKNSLDCRAHCSLVVKDGDHDARAKHRLL